MKAVAAWGAEDLARRHVQDSNSDDHDEFEFTESPPFLHAPNA